MNPSRKNATAISPNRFSLHPFFVSIIAARLCLIFEKHAGADWPCGLFQWWVSGERASIRGTDSSFFENQLSLR
jgi:hypothetical protein